MHIDKAIVYFDGVCNLCNGSVQFIMKRDRRSFFYFSAIQSLSPEILQTVGEGREDIMESLIFGYNGKYYYGSEAVLEIAYYLGYPWRLALIIKVIPFKWRQFLYQVVANNRYKWFGRRKECMVPNKEQKTRFI